MSGGRYKISKEGDLMIDPAYDFILKSRANSEAHHKAILEIYENNKKIENNL